MGTELTEIENLWAEHLKAPFPKEYAGMEIEGIDLALLDGGIAGCVSTFIKYGHEYKYRLDEQRIAILGRLYHDVLIVLPSLNDPAKAYFSRLEKLAGLILEWISSYERNL